MTVYLVMSLPKIPYIHRIYMVLANPTHQAPSHHQYYQILPKHHCQNRTLPKLNVLRCCCRHIPWCADSIKVPNTFGESTNVSHTFAESTNVSDTFAESIKGLNTIAESTKFLTLLVRALKFLTPLLRAQTFLTPLLRALMFQTSLLRALKFSTPEMAAPHTQNLCVVLPHLCVLLPHQCVVLPHLCVVLPHLCVILPHLCFVLPHLCVVLPNLYVVMPHLCHIAAAHRSPRRSYCHCCCVLQRLLQKGSCLEGCVRTPLPHCVWCRGAAMCFKLRAKAKIAMLVHVRSSQYMINA